MKRVYGLLLGLATLTAAGCCHGWCNPGYSSPCGPAGCPPGGGGFAPAPIYPQTGAVYGSYGTYGSMQSAPASPVAWQSGYAQTAMLPLESLPTY